ncbi:MAG: PilZ domain-containing protein [Hyphomicrobium sp.]
MQPEIRTNRQARRLLLGGKIIFNNRNSVFDCVVRALSADGAELRMKSTLGVPDAFELRIGPAGEAFQCDIAWRTETEIGVMFLGKRATASPLLNGLQLGE